MTTTHRIMQSLIKRRFLMRTGKASYRLGSSAIALAEGMSYRDILAPAARPHLQALSKRTKSHVHLGVWNDGMVAYLVKQRYGRVRVHSAEGAQLEGYCSALGKVLLSGLDDDELESYVTEGEFVALTRNTIVDPEELRREIAMVHSRGWATDDEEIAVGLRCIAVPLMSADGRIVAAISVSSVAASTAPVDPMSFLSGLRETADAITAQLFHKRAIRD
jgi:IclR family acetate operon transcriptional repressor